MNKEHERIGRKKTLLPSKKLMETKSIVGKKSSEFALSVIKLYKNVLLPQQEYVLSKQLLRCGTSVGANIHEGLGAYSKKDFAAKMGIAYKKARESEYWLNLLLQSKYISVEQFEHLSTQLTEICKMLYRIIKTTNTLST